jgi:WhiB family redox-sensing transcriptional regulator
MGDIRAILRPALLSGGTGRETGNGERGGTGPEEGVSVLRSGGIPSDAGSLTQNRSPDEERAVVHDQVSSSVTWRDLARCRGVDPEIFYPSADSDGREAKAICALCPVREPCLEYALAAREKDGIWGGLTARERRRLVRRRRKTA